MFTLLVLVLHISLALCQDYVLVWEDNFDTLDLGKWDYEVNAQGGGNNEFQVYTPDSENTFVRDGKLFIKPTLLVNNINPLTGQPFGDEFLNSGVLDLNEMYGRCTEPTYNENKENNENDDCRREGSQGNMPIFMSGRLRSADRFSFKFGRVEVIAKMPVGDWMWPAIWLLPEDWVYGLWPASGEIDITEGIGNRDLVNEEGDFAGIQKMGSTLHWGIRRGQNRYHLTGDHRFNTENNYGDHFHKYEMDWSETGLRLYIDGDLVFQTPDPPIDQNPSWQDFFEFGKPWGPPETNVWADGTNMAPFDEPFHFLLNVAVGGTGGFIPDGLINQGGRFPKPYNNDMSQSDAMRSMWSLREDWYWTWEQEGDNAAMQIDSIKVWQRQ